MRRVGSQGRTGSGSSRLSRRPSSKKVTVRHVALLLLIGAVIACVSSITIFLGILHGIDSEPSADAPASGVSIRALHMLQQAKSRALHANRNEAPSQPSSPSVNATLHLRTLSSVLIPRDPKTLMLLAPSNGNPLGSEPEFLQSPPPNSALGSASVMRTWQEGLGRRCRQWAVAIEEGGEAAMVLGASFYVDPESEAEARDNSSSLAKAQLSTEPLQLSLTLWGPQGTARLYRVQSLRKSLTQQREEGGALLALVPPGVSAASVELCGPPTLPLLGTNESRGVGVQLSFYAPLPPLAADLASLPGEGEAVTANAERQLSSVEGKCELWQAPMLRYVPAANQSTPGGGRGAGQNDSWQAPFPQGQVAVSWESNCPVGMHQVAVCRAGGEGGPCLPPSHLSGCQPGDDSPPCQAGLAAGNSTAGKAGPTHPPPDFIIDACSTIQVSAARWIHIALFPLLPPSRYHYRVASGGKWSPLFHLQIPPPAQLPAQGLPKGGEGGKVPTRRTSHKSPATKWSSKSKGGIGRKGPLSRKAYQRGPVGVSTVGIKEGEFLHVAIMSDTQWGAAGGAPFKRHLAHVMAHKPTPHVLVHLGDRVQDGGVVGEWTKGWQGPMGDGGVGAHVPHLGVWGNHDVDGSGLASAFVGGGGMGAGGGGWYSVVLGNCLWIGLDSNVGAGQDPAQRTWLKETLEALGRARVLGIAPAFTVVMVHIAPFIDYWDPATWRRGENRMGEWVRLEWVPLLEKHKVDLVVGGHSHVYQRGERNGVMYAVVGGGGGGLDKRRVEDWGMYKVTHLGYHYVWLDVSAEKLSWTAFDIANNPVDHVLFEPDTYYTP